MAVVNLKEMVEKIREKQINPTTVLDSRSEIETVDIREIEKQRRINYFKYLSNLPKKVNECRFEKAIVGSKEEQKFKKAFEMYCSKFDYAIQNGIGLYLFGNPGTGKTFYSLCIYNELCDKYKVYRTSLGRIFKRIKGSFSTDTTEEEVFKDLLEADLIILDDLGKEYISENWGKDKIFEIFNFLYENEKAIIISTNLDMKQMTEYTEDKGSDATFDRFKEIFKSFSFEWESKRKGIKNEKFKEIWGSLI